MQNRTYGDLFKLIQSLAGVREFASSEEDDIANFINDRFFDAYNTSQAWARYLVPSEKRIVSAFEVTGTTTTGDEPNLYNGLYYNYGEDINGNPVYVAVNPRSTIAEDPTGVQSNTAFFAKNPTTKTWTFTGGTYSKNVATGVVTATGSVNLRTQEDTSVEYDNPWEVVWETNNSTEVTMDGQVVTRAKQCIPFRQKTAVFNSFQQPKSDSIEIGEFIRVHRSKAFLNNSELEYDFFVDERGANLLNIVNTTDPYAFVTYKKKFTRLTTSSDYKNSTEDVPSEFFAYIAHAVYADFLRMDGQTSKALVEEEVARAYLAKELERLDIINNNNKPTTRISTHVSRQAR
jgi:hypothetical protein